MWAVVPFCIYYNTSENRTQDFLTKQIYSVRFWVNFYPEKTQQRIDKGRFFATKNFRENLPVFHNVFTKCPCGILEEFGDVPQQAFLKFISETALMCTTYISSEMQVCVHECVACYSVKRGFLRRSSPAPARTRRTKPISSDICTKISLEFLLIVLKFS